MRLVIVESPYAGDIEKNLTYLRECMRDCFSRGEAPFASHGLYTQPGVLDDGNQAERVKGMEAGFEWGSAADATVVYLDRGLSRGMAEGIKAAREELHPVELRWLHPSTAADRETLRVQIASL